MKHAIYLCAVLALTLTGCGVLGGNVEAAFETYTDKAEERATAQAATLAELKAQNEALREAWKAGTVADEQYFEQRAAIAEAQTKALGDAIVGNVTDALEAGKAFVEAGKKDIDEGFGLIEGLGAGGLAGIGIEALRRIMADRARQQAAALAAAQVNAERNAARIARGEKV